MRTLSMSVVGTWIVLLMVPSVQAKDCTTQQQDLCDYAKEAKLDRLFGDYSDLAAIFLALLALALVLTALSWVIGRPGRGPKLSAEVRQSMAEVGLGGTVQLLADVENLRKGTSTDMVLEWDELPPGWSAVSFAALALPSGFTVPQAVSHDSPLHLSSAAKGAHKAAVAVQLTAPAEGVGRDNLDLTVRAVPVSGGVLIRRRARRLRFDVVLNEHRPAVQIRTVTHEPEAIAAGRPVLTRAILANQGEAEAREVGVSFLLNDQPVDQKIVPALAPQQETTVEFQWTPTAGENRIRIHLA